MFHPRYSAIEHSDWRGATGTMCGDMHDHLLPDNVFPRETASRWNKFMLLRSLRYQSQLSEEAQGHAHKALSNLLVELNIQKNVVMAGKMSPFQQLTLLHVCRMGKDALEPSLVSMQRASSSGKQNAETKENLTNTVMKDDDDDDGDAKETSERVVKKRKRNDK